MICFYFYFFTFFESIKEIKIIDFLLNAKNTILLYLELN